MLKRKLLKNQPAADYSPDDSETTPRMASEASSPYFHSRMPQADSVKSIPHSPSLLLWQQFYAIECRLNEALADLSFSASNPTLAAVYNPVDYARRLHIQYLERFLVNRPITLFVGMNPGPWGMCQTGVPFGCVSIVRDWMHLNETVDKPTNELAERPVTGLNCVRKEQSGLKFWSLFREIFGENPDTFFGRNFVHNFCPLAFMQAGGRNISPPELKGDVRLELQRLCQKAFREIIELLQPAKVVSVGRYADARVKAVLNSTVLTVSHACMPHPSPRSLNNANWPEKAKNWLEANRIFDTHL